MMRLTLASLLSLAVVPALCQQGPAGTGEQMVLDMIHNVTTLQGTWSTGSKAVTTGPNFANPTNRTFMYPETTGVSYSFTLDGFYEVSQYRYVGNATDPHCITGTLTWEHGEYRIYGNGSIVTTPFGDGFQQVQNPCMATSNFIQAYNFTSLYQSFRIFQDPNDGPKLHLFKFDGSPVAPQFLVSASPMMLPTRTLRNDTPSAAPQKREMQKRSSADKTWMPMGVGALALSLITATAVL